MQMSNGEQVRKNCGSMEAQGNFGREHKYPPRRPSTIIILQLSLCGEEDQMILG